MASKRDSIRVISIASMVLCFLFALCIKGDSQEKLTGVKEGQQMSREVGWAEPDFIIGAPRLQKVVGFHYLYAEQKHVREDEVGSVVPSLIGKANEACQELYGRRVGSFVVMFLNLPPEPGEPRLYDVQVGYAIWEGDVRPAGEAKVRFVEPSLCVALLVWGMEHDTLKSYGPLMDFAEEKGLKCSDEGWREWTFYNEGDDSKNTITWVQHVVEEE